MKNGVAPHYPSFHHSTPAPFRGGHRIKHALELQSRRPCHSNILTLRPIRRQTSRHAPLGTNRKIKPTAPEIPRRKTVKERSTPPWNGQHDLVALGVRAHGQMGWFLRGVLRLAQDCSA